MSQKTSRRQRRPTTDESTAFKSPAKKTNGVEEPPTIVLPEDPPSDTNGTPHEEPVTTRSSKRRSRSATPQHKKPEEAPQILNGTSDSDVIIMEDPKIPEPELLFPVVETPELEKEIEIEMDPLVLSDGPDPELVFEDNASDHESVKESPHSSRCFTRRSDSRNIPTPKTPKGGDDNATPDPEPELNVTFESCSENLSTKAEVGSDATRLEYMDKDISVFETNNFLVENKNKTFGEALRRLSMRRSIRPTGEIRKKVLERNLNASYPARYSVEPVAGTKRKHSDADEADGKRFKTGESPAGFFSRLASPLHSIKNTFRTDLPSSTPKLTGYKDEKFLIANAKNGKLFEGEEGEGDRRWCSIM